MWIDSAEILPEFISSEAITELIQDLDGRGLVITDYDLIDQRLEYWGFESDDVRRAESRI